MTTKKMLCALSATLTLVACQSGDQPQPLTKAQLDQKNITAFCNEIAAELVANPNSTAPLRRLEQKHLEEEWSAEDVDRICSAAIARKTQLLYGKPAGKVGAGGANASGMPSNDLERQADRLEAEADRIHD